MNLSVIFAAAEDDATDVVPSASSCGCDDLFAIPPAVETFDLPDIRLDSGILKLLDRLHHKLRTELNVVRLPVPVDPVQLGLLSGHEQLEHEQAAATVMEVVGQAL